MPQLPTTETEYFIPAGGLDQVTPPLQVPNGYLRDSLNVECAVEGGYRRIAGYERYSAGRGIAARDYYLVELVLSNSVYVLDRVSGDVSGATMFIVGTYQLPAVADVFPFISPAPAGTLTYAADVTGNFIVGENIRSRLTGLVVGHVVAIPAPVTGNTPKEYAQAVARARDSLRIKLPAPGDYTYAAQYANAVGPVVGLFELNDRVYSLRQNKDPNSKLPTGKLGIYRASDDADVASQVPGAYWIQMVGDGSGIPAAGARCEFVVHSFNGSVTHRYVYGVTKTSKAFFFDESTFTQISTGMADDRPTHICAHRNRLFLSFKGSVQFSAVGDPTSWTPVLGAGEIAVGDDVTGLLTLTGGTAGAALLITTKTKTFVLYGNSEADFNLVEYSVNTGAYEGSLVNMGFPLFVNEQGLNNLTTTQKFGGFEMDTLSMRIKPFMAAHRNHVVCATLNRDRNQYRVFFDNGEALYVTLRGEKIIGMTPMRLPFVPAACWHSVLSDGSELTLLSDQFGQVYRMDAGACFDGDPIYWFFRMVFNHLKSPRMRKTFKVAILECVGDGYSEFAFNYDLGYGDPNININDDVVIQGTNANEGLNWDTSNWDQIWWDGRDLTPARCRVSGTAENISLLLQGYSDHVESFAVTGVLLHYIHRRKSR